MAVEYRIYDRRNDQVVHIGIYPDSSAKSENAAIRQAGIRGEFAECETRELSDDALHEIFPSPPRIDCVVEYTPNGREIRRRTDGRLEVQPHNDNYWLIVDTVEQARDAFAHPEKHYS